MKKTALILGGFGGVGYACASILAENGYDLVVVHRGRRAKAEENKQKVQELEKFGINVVEIKGNATTPECMAKVCNELRDVRVNCYVHAIADGNIGNIFGGDRILNADSFLYTFNSMCVSFASWTQVLLEKGILEGNSHIFGFSSEGASVVFPQYVANGIAKAGLETLCRYMADELAGKKISVNIIRAGIMDTTAVLAFGERYYMQELVQKGCRTSSPRVVAEKMMSIINTEDFVTGQIVDV
ncbi:MAG: SDR family oxidoreductase [Bacteroidales bacterium]|nr:SDR family oxidoreductase [Bacteroidales bacterium]